MASEKICGSCKDFFPRSELCKAYGFKCLVCAENKACSRWRAEKPMEVIKKTQRLRGGWMPYVWQYYCPHCKKQLGWVNFEKKPSSCPMCRKPITWKGVPNGK